MPLLIVNIYYPSLKLTGSSALLLIITFCGVTTADLTRKHSNLVREVVGIAHSRQLANYFRTFKNLLFQFVFILFFLFYFNRQVT